jgi:hypothetical protein
MKNKVQRPPREKGKTRKPSEADTSELQPETRQNPDPADNRSADHSLVTNQDEQHIITNGSESQDPMGEKEKEGM